MLQPEQKFLALDSETLRALHFGLPKSTAALAFFRGIRFLPMVTPTPYAIWRDMEENAPDMQDRMLAQRVIQDIHDSEYVIVPLDDTYRQVLDIHAGKLLEKKAFTHLEKADVLVLLEASHFGAHVILTNSQKLLSVNNETLKMALLECGLEPLYVFSPDAVATAIEDLRANGGV